MIRVVTCVQTNEWVDNPLPVVIHQRLNGIECLFCKETNKNTNIVQSILWHVDKTWDADDHSTSFEHFWNLELPDSVVQMPHQHRCDGIVSS